MSSSDEKEEDEEVEEIEEEDDAESDVEEESSKSNGFSSQKEEYDQLMERFEEECQEKGLKVVLSETVKNKIFDEGLGTAVNVQYFMQDKDRMKLFMDMTGINGMGLSVLQMVSLKVLQRQGLLCLNVKGTTYMFCL